MNIKLAAEKLNAWCISTGLINTDQREFVNAATIDTGDLFPVTAVEILRKKHVQSISYNDKRNEITIFTGRSLVINKKNQNALPSTFEGYSIKYRQGTINPVGGHIGVPFSSPPWTMRQCLNGQNRYACGSSISIGNSREAGTLGVLVKDQQGQVYGLSNNHVSGSCNFAQNGLPILAPGVYDVMPNGVDPFCIGHHVKSLPMVTGLPDQINADTNSDASLFKISNLVNVTSFQGNLYDTPVSAVELQCDMEVEKVGRTTGATLGRVHSIRLGYTAISYSAQLHNFNGVVYFKDMYVIIGHGDLFSTNGDSGSLITHKAADGTRYAVGIVVGGMDDVNAPGGKLSLALPIKPILESFNVELVTNLNI